MTQIQIRIIAIVLALLAIIFEIIIHFINSKKQDLYIDNLNRDEKSREYHYNLLLREKLTTAKNFMRLLSAVAVIGLAVLPFLISQQESEPVVTVMLASNNVEKGLDEGEPNDIPMYAREIELNTTISGFLHDSYQNGEQDWFVFQVFDGDSGVITLNLHEQGGFAEDKFWDFYIYKDKDIYPNPKKSYDTNAAPYYHNYFCGKHKGVVYSGLSPGKYYLRLESSNRHSDDMYSMSFINRLK